MNKDFVLITGHGIFPTASILQVVPVTDITFELSVAPPITPELKFVFTVTKNVSVNAEVARSNPTKKNEVDVLTDYGYGQQFSDGFDFEQDEFLSILALEDDDTIKGYIKDYTRRLKKISDYQAAIAVIESNPDLPDYQTSLNAVRQNAPSSSTERKQEKTLNKIHTYLLDKVLAVIEAADPDEDDYTGKKFIDVINAEEFMDNTEAAGHLVLKSFYRKNFDLHGETDDGEDEDAVIYDDDSSVEYDDADDRIMAETALTNAEAIKLSPETITNRLVDNDEDEELDPDSPVAR